MKAKIGCTKFMSVVLNEGDYRANESKRCCGVAPVTVTHC